MARTKKTTPPNRRPRRRKSTSISASKTAARLTLRDWIAQATEADLAELDQLVAGGPATAAADGPKWTAATLGEVAAFLGVQLQTVKEWRTGPNPMPGGEGRWPLDEIVRWRFAKMQFTGRAENPQGKSSLENEHLEISNARLLLKLRKESSELISRAAAKVAVTQMFHRLRGQLQPLPDILASAVPAASRADFLFDARNRVRLFLMAIANWQFDAEVAPAASDPLNPKGKSWEPTETESSKSAPPSG